MISVAEMLLEITNEYNGHKQTTINWLSIEDAQRICKDLEELTNKEYSFVLEVWTDGSMTIYQKDFFADGRSHGPDRIILRIEN